MIVKKLGVLGGMGPAASAEFMTRLTAHTVASCDQDHIPTILWSDPRVPDRSSSIRNGDNLPLPWLEHGVRGLQSAGCTHIVMPCNTAHFWYNDLVKLGTPITHIVDSVADELRRIEVINTRIGILGTQATVEMGLYTNHLDALGWQCIGASRHYMDNFVQPAIKLIKSNNIDSAHELLMYAINDLINSGVDAIVLGCTEIPLAVTQQSERNIPLINSIDSLVKSTISWYNS